MQQRFTLKSRADLAELYRVPEAYLDVSPPSCGAGEPRATPQHRANSRAPGGDAPAPHPCQRCGEVFVQLWPDAMCVDCTDYVGFQLELPLPRSGEPQASPSFWQLSAFP